MHRLHKVTCKCTIVRDRKVFCLFVFGLVYFGGFFFFLLFIDIDTREHVDSDNMHECPCLL